MVRRVVRLEALGEKMSGSLGDAGHYPRALYGEEIILWPIRGVAVRPQDVPDYDTFDVLHGGVGVVLLEVASSAKNL